MTPFWQTVLTLACMYFAHSWGVRRGYVVGFGDGREFGKMDAIIEQRLDELELKGEDEHDK